MAEPLQPNLAILRGRCERIETGIEVVWSLGPAKGARSYAVWMSYDGGATRELLWNGPGTEGRAPIRQSESIVTLFAVAYGRTGLPGREISTTFTTVAPIVRGALVDVATLPPIDYSGLTQDVRTRIENALSTAQQGVSTAQDALTKALASLDNDALNASAIVAEQTARANQDGALATRIDGVVAKTDDNAAAITSEQTARTNADGALGQRIDAVVATANNALAGVTSEQTARANADGALGQRIDAVVATADNALAGVTSEQTARANADGALGQRIDAVVATANNALAGVSNEATARVDADGALAGQISAVSARTDAGTASGRSSLRASSGIAGVQARFETLLAVEAGGQIRGAGYYIDLMPDGSSRFVVDASAFYITANGQTAPALSFDGYTLTIPSLRVTQQAILPGSASEPRSIAVENVNPGGSSDEWREIPGTAFEIVPDSSQWSIVFSAAARGQVTATGTSSLYLATSLQIAIGVDGVPYGIGAFLSMSVGSGAGVAPIPNSSTGGIVFSSASLEVLPAGLNRRFSLLYKFKADPGGTGSILYAQIKAIINKR